MKSANELIKEGLRIKEVHAKKIGTTNIIVTERCDEVLDFIDDVIYFCDNAKVDKKIQESLKNGIKFIPGNPITNLERQLENLEKLT